MPLFLESWLSLIQDFNIPNRGINFIPRLDSVPESTIKTNLGINYVLNLTHLARTLNSLIGGKSENWREIWSRANIHIIFLSVSSVEEIPLFRGKGHFLNPRFFLHSGDTLVLRTWLTTKRVDKLKCSLITMIAAFTAWTIIISFKLKVMYCTCRNNNATICWRKVNCDFLFSCLKNDNCGRFKNLNKSSVGQLLANLLPNLYSRDASTVYSGDSPDSFSQFWGCPQPWTEVPL